MVVLAGAEPEWLHTQDSLPEQEAGDDGHILHYSLCCTPERGCGCGECVLDVGIVDGASRMKRVRRGTRRATWEGEKVVELRAGACSSYNERRSNSGSA